MAQTIRSPPKRRLGSNYEEHRLPVGKTIVPLHWKQDQRKQIGCMVIELVIA